MEEVGSGGEGSKKVLIENDGRLKWSWTTKSCCWV